MSLADIIAAKKRGEPLPNSSLSASIEDDSDLFLLSGTASDDRNLRALLHLVHKAGARSNLLANDFERLRKLVAWLAPFPSSHLPYIEPIPRFLQSYQMWQLAAILQIPPAKLWPVLWEVLVEAEKISLDKNPKID